MSLNPFQADAAIAARFARQSADVGDRLAAEITRLVAQEKSLMPDLMLRDMTARQVADLVAFLRSLK